MKTRPEYRTQHSNRRHLLGRRVLRMGWFPLLATILIVFIVFQFFYRVIKPQQPEKGTTIASESASETTRKTNYGIALNGALATANDAGRTAMLNQIKKAGFQEVRISIYWNMVEPQKGTFDWSNSDAVMTAIKRSGLSSIVLLDYAPQWARLDACKADGNCSPAGSGDFAKFAAAAVGRYKNHDVAAWEIWNEQNGNNFWHPLPNPNQYARLLKASYLAIKQANPKATVLVGGLSGDTTDTNGVNMIDARTFLGQLYGANAKGFFDGVAYHPYIKPGPLDQAGGQNGWSKLSGDQNALREVMIAHGDGNKAIWLTEFGMPTAGKVAANDLRNIPAGADHLTYQAQADLAQSIVNKLQSTPWLRNLDWYSYKDGYQNPNKTASYGLWEYSGKPKPIVSVLQEAITDLH